MPAKFKKRDKILLIEKIDLFDGSSIPVGARGTISDTPYKSGNAYYYSVDFDKFPRFSQSMVPENFMVPFKEEKLDAAALNNNQEFSEWLEAYVQKRIKAEMGEVCKRCLAEGLSKTKVKKITTLTTIEVDEIVVTIET